MQLKILIIVFVFVLLAVLLKTVFSCEEEIVDLLKTNDAGIISNDGKLPKYINNDDSFISSDIKLLSNTKLNQSVNKYFEIYGFSKIKPSIFFRNVIVEVRYQNEEKAFFTFPVNDFGFFNGFIYFTQTGKASIYLYNFFDYLNDNKENKLLIYKNYNTIASVLFYCNVVKAIPKEMVYLLPTKNINCGNKKIKKTALILSKNTTSNYERARKIFEYIIDLRKLNKIHFTSYKIVKEYHFALSASQTLDDKKGICNDFAELYAALLRAQGIKVKKVWGYGDRLKRTGHMWNSLDLTGDEKEWIQADLTWALFDPIHYQKYAGFYKDFDSDYFNNAFSPDNHNSFIYDKKIEF